MIPDDLSIPDFLRRDRRDPAPLPPAKRIRVQRPRSPRPHYLHGLPLARSIEPAGLELLKEIERKEAAAKKARLAALKERRR